MIKRKKFYDAGIIGGMGPAATAELFRKTVSFTEAKSDSQHISLCILNVPYIPDRTDFILGNRTFGKSAPSPLKIIKKQIHILKKLHCGFFAIPCNTAHYFYKYYEKIRGITFINMVSQTLKYTVFRHPDKNICVLATPGTVKSDIYGAHAISINKGKISPLPVIRYPSDSINKEISEIISEIKSGKIPSDSKIEDLKILLKSEYDSENTVYILGCTELSLITEKFKDFTIVDSTEVLAASIVFACKKNINKEIPGLWKSFFKRHADLKTL